MNSCEHQSLEFCSACQGVGCNDCERYWWDKLYHSIGGRPTSTSGFISTGPGMGMPPCKHKELPKPDALSAFL